MKLGMAGNDETFDEAKGIRLDRAALQNGRCVAKNHALAVK
jgi:hypothetical protein